MNSTDLKAYVGNILLNHKGKAQAITGQKLAAMVGHRDDRRVRQVIRELIIDGLPVASSTESPAGYFLVTSHHEAEEYASSIRSRLIEDALRRRDFRRAAAMHLAPAKQGRLLV